MLDLLVTIEIPYDDTDVWDEHQLKALMYDQTTGSWNALPIIERNTETNRIVCQTDHFSTVGVGEDRDRPFFEDVHILFDDLNQLKFSFYMTNLIKLKPNCDEQSPFWNDWDWFDDNKGFLPILGGTLYSLDHDLSHLNDINVTWVYWVRALQKGFLISKEIGSTSIEFSVRKTRCDPILFSYRVVIYQDDKELTTVSAGSSPCRGELIPSELAEVVGGILLNGEGLREFIFPGIKLQDLDPSKEYFLEIRGNVEEDAPLDIGGRRIAKFYKKDVKIRSRLDLGDTLGPSLSITSHSDGDHVDTATIPLSGWETTKEGEIMAFRRSWSMGAERTTTRQSEVRRRTGTR